MGYTNENGIYFNAFVLTPWRDMHDTVINSIIISVQLECMDAIWNFTKDTLWSSVDNSVSGHSTVDNFIKSYDS